MASIHRARGMSIFWIVVMLISVAFSASMIRGKSNYYWFPILAGLTIIAIESIALYQTFPKKKSDG